MTVPTNPTVLSWARETRGLTLDAAAELLEWPVDKLAEIEGSTSVAASDLERMAAKYKLPLPTLLMPEPLPADRYGLRPITDFRLHADETAEPISVATRLHVEGAYELIELLAEVGDADPKSVKVPNLPRYTLQDKAADAAAAERERIAPQVDVQLGWASDKEAFLRWREIIESQGVIVHKFPLHEKSVRGFAVFDEGFGVVVVDSGDDYRPRVFTILHEYAHLLLRASGISDQNREIPTEQWCNQFAANFLMPVEAFRSEYYLLFPKAKVATERQVSRLSTRFRVSKSSVALRFEETGLAPSGFYDTLKAEWQKRERRSGGGGGGPNDPIDVELGRYGTTHVSTVGSALRRGVIDHVEARYALDVAREHIPPLEAAARQRRRAYGAAE